MKYMVSLHHFYKPLTEADLALASVDMWECAAKLAYGAVCGQAPAKDKLVMLLKCYDRQANRDTLILLAARGNRHAAWELVTIVAHALVLEAMEDRIRGAS